MVIAIRIDPKQRRNIFCLAAVLIFLSPACGAEMEIYVTTGPGGVEVFSNLPRGPLAQPTVAEAKARDVAFLSMQSVPAQRQEMDALHAPEGSNNEPPEPGKSFLLDD